MRGWLLLVVLAGCGTDSSGGPYTALADFKDQLHAAQCTHLVACHEVADQATCLAMNNDVTVFEIDAFTAQEVGLGRLRYNGSAVAACLAQFAARSCDSASFSNRAGLSCMSEAFSPIVATGKACYTTGECLTGECQFHSCPQGDTCCGGICEGSAAPKPPGLPIGATCSVSLESPDPCALGGYCDNTQCVADKLLGDACNGPVQCGDGLTCPSFPTNGGTPTCSKHPHLGESCATDPTCGDEGSYCDQTSQLCKPVALLGESCTNGPCSPLYLCDGTTCIARPATGMPCNSDCNDYGTVCDAQHVCSVPAANGTPCTSPDQCASGDCAVTQATESCIAVPVCL